MSLKDQCTQSKKGRQIKRYVGDARKEVLQAHMMDETVRKRYQKRQAMVEPVFSVLKLRQGLTRFRRMGLKAVRCEFALHVMAYNMSRGHRKELTYMDFHHNAALRYRSVRALLTHTAPTSGQTRSHST